MTRRAFLRNLSLACAALGVPVAAGQSVRGMRAVTFKFSDVKNDCVQFASQPVFPEWGYCIIHRRG